MVPAVHVAVDEEEDVPLVRQGKRLDAVLFKIRAEAFVLPAPEGPDADRAVLLGVAEPQVPRGDEGRLHAVRA